jgi:hypothetical protein
MAAELDDHSENENEDRAYEFLDSLESDPSKAELMSICQRMNNLLITLKCKRDELQTLEVSIVRAKGEGILLK